MGFQIGIKLGIYKFLKKKTQNVNQTEREIDVPIENPISIGGVGTTKL